MKTVMCFGTFDILHQGHLNYFEQAKKHGDYLIVVVARDATKKVQGKTPMFSEKERLELIKKEKIVDEAVLGNIKNHLKIIVDKKPDVICLGYDQKVEEKKLAQELAKMEVSPEIIRLKPFHPEKYKSSLYKEKLKKLPDFN